MQALDRRHMLAGTLLAAGSMAVTLPLPVRAARQPLSFVSSRPGADPRTQWLIALYGEALDPLGYDLVFVDVPVSRAVVMETSGEVDGDLARAWSFGTAHPESGLYLDIEEAVYDYLSTPQAYETLQRGLPIIEAGVMEQQTGHAFLNRSSCGDLASALSDTLREMKAKGRCALLLAQALAAAGYRDRPLFGPRPG